MPTYRRHAVEEAKVPQLHPLTSHKLLLGIEWSIQEEVADRGAGDEHKDIANFTISTDIQGTKGKREGYTPQGCLCQRENNGKVITLDRQQREEHILGEQRRLWEEL